MAMMNEQSMPLYYWAEACHIAVHIMNCTPTPSVHNVLPYEKLWGRKPTLSYFKVFGNLCYVHVPAKTRHKMDSRSTKCVFLGYPDERKSYKCYDPSTKKVYVSRDVIFDEKDSWYKAQKEVSIPDSDEVYARRSPSDQRRDISETLSGPKDFETSTSSSPWNGRRTNNGKQKVDEYDASGILSDTSIDSETELPKVQTPGILRRTSKYVPPHERQAQLEPALRRSQRVRYPVDRLTYSGYMRMHYNYMVAKV